MVKTLCTLGQTKSQYGAVTSAETTDELCDTLAPYAGLDINVDYVLDMYFRLSFNRIIVFIYFARRLTFRQSNSMHGWKTSGEFKNSFGGLTAAYKSCVSDFSCYRPSW